MNNFDYIIIAIIGISTVIAVWRGFVKEFISLLSFAAAFFIAGRASTLASDFLSTWIANETLADIAGFALVFIGIMMLGSLISYVLYQIIDMADLSILDRILAVFFGISRGTLFIAIGFLIYLSLYANGAKASWLKDSLLTPYAIELSELLGQSIPQGYPLSRQETRILSTDTTINEKLLDAAESLKDHTQ